MSEIFAGCLLHEPEDLLLPLPCGGRCTRRCRAFGSSITSPWPGQIRESRSFFEPLERLQVDGHVAAAGGVHHRAHAVEDGVAGEQHPLLLEEEAQVVRARGRACAAPRARTRCPRWCRPRRWSGRARRRRRPCRACVRRTRAPRRRSASTSRLVPGEWSGCVWVSSTQRTRSLHRRADDRVDVAGVVGTRIDDRDLVDADEVRVGAGAGERAGVRGDDAAHERRERARDAGRQVGHVNPSAGRALVERGVVEPRRRSRSASSIMSRASIQPWPRSTLRIGSGSVRHTSSTAANSSADVENAASDCSDR